MSDLNEIVSMGRLLYAHRLWKEFTKNAPAENIHGQSRLEEANIDISAFVLKFNEVCATYFKTIIDKEKAFKELCDKISLPFHDDVDEEQRVNAEKMAEEVIQKYKGANANDQSTS